MNTQSVTHEASMNLRKFVRLLRVRLATQGFKATLLWMSNVFNRYVLDRPVRSLCEVTPQLFVGPQFRRRGWHRLKGWGITAVVNLRSEFDDRRLGVDMPAYLHLPTEDDAPPTLEDLSRGAAFINEQISMGGKVYIHCGAGVGRAPTMAAASLVAQGMSPEQAWETIQRVRVFIRPTEGQRKQLEIFALRLAEDLNN